MRFFRSPYLLRLLYPNLLWRMPDASGDASGKVYLTFDDGPVPGPTEFVLETLGRYHIPATFFCIGDNVRKHPDLFRQIAHSVYTIGNHTSNHLNGWKTRAVHYLANVAECEAAMHRVVPQLKTRLFRPPYGKITYRQLSRLTGYRIVMWDVLTYDFDDGLSPEACLRHTLQMVRSGSIVVFHDSYKAWPRLHYVLPRLIEHLSEKGFSFAALSA